MSKPNRCWRCDASVQWLPLRGVPVAIEPCQPGTGDIVIQRELNGSEIAIAASAGRFRRHAATCKSPSFVATALAKKVRL